MHVELPRYNGDQKQEHDDFDVDTSLGLEVSKAMGA
jgi:hypothetical protein